MKAHCPACDSTEFQELGIRLTWQRCTLVITDAGISEGYYEEFDYSDDVKVCGYECYACQSTFRLIDGELVPDPLNEWTLS